MNNGITLPNVLNKHDSMEEMNKVMIWIRDRLEKRNKLSLGSVCKIMMNIVNFDVILNIHKMLTLLLLLSFALVVVKRTIFDGIGMRSNSKHHVEVAEATSQ